MSFTSEESRWSDVYVATGARGVSVCGDFLAATALALALQSAGAGGVAVAGLMIAAALPLVVLAPVAGRLADRVDSRTLLIAVGLAQAAVCAALAYAQRPALIIVLAALLSSGLAVTQPTLAALLPDMVRPADLPRAAALNQTAGAVGMLVAPALAGLLVGQFGVRLPLLLDAASFFALVAAGLLLRTRRGGHRSVPAGAAAPSPVRWRLRQDRLVLASVVAVAATIAGVGAISVIDVFFVRETLRAGTTTYGLVGAAWTGGLLVGAWLLARPVRRARDDGALVRGLLVVLGVTCLVVIAGAGAPSAAWLMPLWLLGGVFNGGLNVLSTLIMARRVPSAVRGYAFAIQNATWQGAAMFGFLVGGVLLERFPPRPLVAFCGLAGLLVVLVLVVPVWRTVREERAAFTTPAATARSWAGTARYGGDHEASTSRPHPVPQLSADLLGLDALRRAHRC